MTSHAIEVKGIIKQHGDKTAVDGVTFDVENGKIFDLLCRR